MTNGPSANKQPHYIGLEEARQVLAEMGVALSPRQMKRAADMDARGRRKLPFFVDPIEAREWLLQPGQAGERFKFFRRCAGRGDLAQRRKWRAGPVCSGDSRMSIWS